MSEAVSVNKENVRKWVDVLRSGEFPQGKGALLYGGRYCCLGVATEIYRRETGVGDWTVDDEDEPEIRIFRSPKEDEALSLPIEVADWLGLGDNCNPTIDGRSLAERNDNGATFAEIADMIEREWLTEAE